MLTWASFSVAKKVLIIKLITYWEERTSTALEFRRLRYSELRLAGQQLSTQWKSDARTL